MAIIFDEQNKTFTIHTEHSTYQMQIDPENLKRRGNQTNENRF